MKRLNTSQFIGYVPTFLFILPRFTFFYFFQISLNVLLNFMLHTIFGFDMLRVIICRMDPIQIPPPRPEICGLRNTLTLLTTHAAG